MLSYIKNLIGNIFGRKEEEPAPLPPRRLREWIIWTGDTGCAGPRLLDHEVVIDGCRARIINYTRLKIEIEWIDTPPKRETE